jgi:ERCC4-type nuclease
MVNFETDESVQEREIDIVTQDITDIFRHAEGLLKRFGSQGDEANISQQELTVRSNMQRSMAKKLQGLSANFRTSQKVHQFLIRCFDVQCGG